MLWWFGYRGRSHFASISPSAPISSQPAMRRAQLETRFSTCSDQLKLAQLTFLMVEFVTLHPRPRLKSKRVDLQLCAVPDGWHTLQYTASRHVVGCALPMRLIIGLSFSYTAKSQFSTISTSKTDGWNGRSNTIGRSPSFTNRSCTNAPRGQRSKTRGGDWRITYVGAGRRQITSFWR
jgi:hypothetical protein